MDSEKKENTLRNKLSDYLDMEDVFREIEELDMESVLREAVKKDVQAWAKRITASDVFADLGKDGPSFELSDILDTRHVFTEGGEYWGSELTVAKGGPTILIDTRNRVVRGLIPGQAPVECSFYHHGNIWKEVRAQAISAATQKAAEQGGAVVRTLPKKEY